MSHSAHAVQWEGKSDNNRGLIYGIEYMDGDEVADVEWFKSARIRDGNLKLYLDDLKTWDETFNADESMSPAEFAKLMGAYPEPAGNPLPTYGGYMDNSAANFSWVQNNDYFGAETDLTFPCSYCGENEAEVNVQDLLYEWEIVGDKEGGRKFSGAGDSLLHIGDVNKWVCDTCYSDARDDGFYAETDLTPTNHMNNSIGQVVPITNPMELPTNLIETEAGGGPEGQITPDVFSANEYCEECSYMEHDACPMIEGCPCCDNTRQGMMGAETFEAKQDFDSWKTGVIRMAIDNGCFTDDYAQFVAKEIGHDSKRFNAPYGGAGSIMDIGKSTPLADFTDEELTTSSAIHGDFDQASLDYSGHQNIEVRAEGTGRPYWIKKVSFQGNGKAASEAGGNPFYPDGLFTSAAAAKRDLQKMLEIAKDLPEVRISIGNQYYSNYQQPLADAVYHWRTKHKGTDHRTTHHGFSVWLPYGHYQITYEVVNKLGAENFNAEKKNCGCGQDPCKTFGAETFEAETYQKTLWAKGDMRIVADYHDDFWNLDVESWGWESDEEYEQFVNRVNEYGVYILTLEKWNPEVSVGWDYVDGVSGNVPSETQSLMDIAREQFSEFGDFKEAESFDAETFEAFQNNPEFKEQNHYADEEEFYEMVAEMDMVSDGMAVVSNIHNETVGAVEVIDDKDDDEMVEISIQDENLDEIGSFTLDDGMILDDEDNYLAENKVSPMALLTGVVIGGLAWMNRDKLSASAKSMFSADTQEVLENAPELVENPDTGDLDPAQYEELVVESTGYAVDIIPMGLDGSFMGSRFAALPTERYVEYNDPGIGAHTDIAMNRDEVYLEPEMAMVQAAEGEPVVKEAQAPGQSPYLSVDGQEPKDFSYRVIKETHPVSLDPAVVPFIPQSMAGYTGNANRPPSVYEKMFNIGVLGQTPLFTPQDEGDIGASHAGSRRATPNTLGLNGSVGGPLSDKVNANYTDGTTSMSLAQWAIENTVSQSSDTEAVVIDRSSGAMKRVRRV